MPPGTPNENDTNDQLANYLSKRDHDNNDDVTINIGAEVPIVLGVVIIGMLLACFLYHMCYKKYRGHLEMQRSNRANSRSQVRFLLRTGGRTRLARGMPDISPSNSLPDYNDLPPSYKDAVTKIPKYQIPVSPIGEILPPDYEETPKR